MITARESATGENENQGGKGEVPERIAGRFPGHGTGGTATAAPGSPEFSKRIDDFAERIVDGSTPVAAPTEISGDPTRSILGFPNNFV